MPTAEIVYPVTPFEGVLVFYCLEADLNRLQRYKEWPPLLLLPDQLEYGYGLILNGTDSHIAQVLYWEELEHLGGLCYQPKGIRVEDLADVSHVRLSLVANMNEYVNGKPERMSIIHCSEPSVCHQRWFNAETWDKNVIEQNQEWLALTRKAYRDSNERMRKHKLWSISLTILSNQKVIPTVFKRDPKHLYNLIRSRGWVTIEETFS